MKLNLIMNEDDIIPSYLNVGPYISKESEYTKCSDIKNLDTFLDDGEAEEIIAYRVLKYISYNSIPSVLAHWGKKLKRGGKLIIEEVDVQNVCREFTYRRMDLTELNASLYGDEDHIDCKSVLRIPELCKLMEEIGFKIMIKRLQGNFLIIEGVRP